MSYAYRFISRGVVVAGGVAVYKIATTDADDYRSFASGIKQGFQEFVADQEKQIALEQNSSLTDQEAADIGVANARETVNGFFDNAINTTKSTANNIAFNAQKYWQLYSKIIANVADNGITEESGGIIGPNEKFHARVLDYNSGINISGYKTLENIGTSTEVMNGRSYVVKGKVTATNVQGAQFNYLNSTYLTTPILFLMPYVDGTTTYLWSVTMALFFDRNTGNYIGYDKIYTDSLTGSFDEMLEKYITNTSCPVVVTRTNEGQIPINRARELCAVIGANPSVISVGEGSVVPTWQRTIHNTLNSTKFGDAIQTGRRQLVNEGDHIISVFKEDSVPVNKVGLRENEGVMTGDIGWQIPQTWDDYFGGSIPFRDVVGGTGSIAVPYPDVIPGTLPDRKVVDFPADADVQDSADYPKNPADEGEGEGEKPQEIPDKPAQDVFETQGGNYYPTAMDLTNIFPFCIPFDLIYLVEKFDIHGANAPVITIPIVYPQVMANATGSDRYDVVIDFADFLVLRNIVRIFCC